MSKLKRERVLSVNVVSVSQAVGALFILIALWGFSPWLVPYAASIIQIDHIIITDIPPYDAIRIGVSAFLLLVGTGLLLLKKGIK